MNLALPFHQCRSCHKRAGSWCSGRHTKDTVRGVCFSCQQEGLLFSFEAMEKAMEVAERQRRQRSPQAIGPNADKPSRQLKDWPAGLWYGSTPVVIIKGK